MTNEARIAELQRVLGIATATSEKGFGLSISEALVRSGYQEIQSDLTESDLVPLLNGNPELVESWIQYSEDKRTSGGWYILRKTLEVGSLANSQQNRKFDSIAEAVAAYVLFELEFWASENAT
jgi:hypothetical protein